MRKSIHAAVLCLTCALALPGQTEPPQPPQSAVQAPNVEAPVNEQTAPQNNTSAPSSPAPQNPAGGTTATQDPNDSSVDPNVVDKRVFGVIPNNRTTSGLAPYQPISGSHKIVIALKDSFDWPSYITGALFAGLYQLENSNPSFGQGAAGYFRRFGTASADQVIGNMMTEGFVPAAFHQDPRYFQLGPGGGTRRHRLWHALTSTMVAPMDSGRKTFNFSEWGGNAIGAAISNAYYPDTRTASDNVEKLMIAVGTDTFSNVAKEFWPDVKLWLQHKTGKKPAAGVVAH
jgi:hypothetical protein